MRRPWNQPVLAVALGAGTVLAAWATGGLGTALIPVLVVGGYLAGRRVDSLATGLWAMCAGFAVALALVAATTDLAWYSVGFEVFLPALFLVVLPWWIGRSRLLTVTRRRREHEQVAGRARLLERQRIARTMHDQLGHDLALVALRAGALQVAHEDPEVIEAARAIRGQADAAVESLHEIVALLREEPVDLDLTPAEESVADLIERLRSHDVPLEVTVTGEPPETGTVWAATVHGVIQEATTNALKYAPGETIHLHLDTRGPDARVRVSNAVHTHGPDQPAAPRTGAHGLTGLAARVELLGGTFAAGPRRGGFEVSAVVPRANPSPGTGAPPEVRLPAHRGRSAILPAGLLLAVLTGLLVVHAVTFRATALTPARFAELDLGTPMTEVRAQVGADGLERPSPTLAEPARPDGAACRYFAARASLFDLSSDMFRLCSRDGVLVSKDHLSASGTSGS